MRHLLPTQHPNELMGSQVPAQVSRERSQGGFPPPSPLLMENLQPGSSVGSVITVGMLNQHLAIGTEGMELGGALGPPGGIQGALG